MSRNAQRIALLGTCVLVTMTGLYRHSESRAAIHKGPSVTSWNQKTAAAYLDQRETWWMEWPKAARDHGTFCISCHTAVPYALARPALRDALGEPGPSPNERRLI